MSVLLGSHPPELPVGTLVRTSELFGVSEGSARVALSRLCSEGDVAAESGRYRLSERLLERQQAQDASTWPATRRWSGAWELAIAQPHVSAAQRSTIASSMKRLGLAEMRGGVWARPDNLARPWPNGFGGDLGADVRAEVGEIGADVVRFVGRPDRPASELVEKLWDLGGWAKTAEGLLLSMEEATTPADRFVAAAAMVRHLRTDPVLPATLLPPAWPGPRLRKAYLDYRRELADLLSEQVESD